MNFKKTLIFIVLLLAISGCYQTNTIYEADNSNLDEEQETTVEDAVTKTVEVDKGRAITEEDYSVIVTGTEGEVIELNPEAIDPDGDVVQYTFEEPFNSEGKWATKKGESGDYLITINAFDGVEKTSQEVLVRVEKADMPPVMNCPESIKVNEGDEVKIDCGVFDPEGNEVIVAYRGFMTTSKYKTTNKDSGKHKVVVTAWDKQNVEEKIQEHITIHVKDVNRVPNVYFRVDTEIVAMEGDSIDVSPRAEDPDGDEITITYNAPFGSDGTWKTEIGDAGLYPVTVTVSDGVNTISQGFTVLLEKSNTAPVVEKIKDVHVDEGETVKIVVDATDREGDYLDTKFSGFMEDDEYTTTYEDANPSGCSEKGCTATYTVTVTVSDGELETVQDVRVHVKDKNRPPFFKVPA